VCEFWGGSRNESLARGKLFLTKNEEPMQSRRGSKTGVSEQCWTPSEKEQPHGIGRGIYLH